MNTSGVELFIIYICIPSTLLQYVACSRLSTGTRKLYYTITPKLSGLEKKNSDLLLLTSQQVNLVVFQVTTGFAPTSAVSNELGRRFCVLAILLYLWGHLASALLCVHLTSLQQASSGTNS